MPEAGIVNHLEVVSRPKPPIARRVCEVNAKGTHDHQHDQRESGHDEEEEHARRDHDKTEAFLLPDVGRSHGLFPFSSLEHDNSPSREYHHLREWRFKALHSRLHLYFSMNFAMFSLASSRAFFGVVCFASAD